MEQIANAWAPPVKSINSAHIISAKFKLLRRILKKWSKSLSNLTRLINNCNLTIAFLDKLEEIRCLYPQEAAFRSVIKRHIRNLLAMKTAYWRQRYTQRVMQFGDENTKFFHAMATERYRSNVISQIMDSTGRTVNNHGEKSALFYQEFKRRFGFAVETNMQFDLQLLIQLLRLVQRKLMGLFWICPMTKPPALMDSTAYFSKKHGLSSGLTCISYVKISFCKRLTSRASTPPISLLCPRRTILNLSMTSDPSPFSTALSNCSLRSLQTGSKEWLCRLFMKINMGSLRGRQFRIVWDEFLNTCINAISPKEKLSF
jgi:hypothetical protein